MPTVLIGIDPGTYCGWAVLDATTGARLASGTWDLKPRRTEGAGMRYLHFQRHLSALFEAFPEVEVIAYEEVHRHAGTDAAHVYGGIVASLQSWCEHRGITTYVGVPVGTVKKRATGKGNAPKEAMVAAAVKRWSFPTDLEADDEADALWVAEAWRLEGRR